MEDLLAKRIRDRYETLREKRRAWESLWQDIARYVMPRRAPGMAGSVGAPANDTESRLFDTTAVQANMTLANGQLAWMSPMESVLVRLRAAGAAQARRRQALAVRRHHRGARRARGLELLRGGARVLPRPRRLRHRGHVCRARAQESAQLQGLAGRHLRHRRGRGGRHRHRHPRVRTHRAPGGGEVRRGQACTRRSPSASRAAPTRANEDQVPARHLPAPRMPSATR